MFQPWHAIEHPDLAGRRVEVGGFDPLLGVVPPRPLIDSLGVKQGTFARTLLAGMPRLDIDTAEPTALGDGLYRVSIEIVYAGWLPSATEVGVKTRRGRPVRAEIEK